MEIKLEKVNGTIFFKHKEKNNTIAKTIEVYINRKNGSDLSYVNLQGADLRYIDFNGVNFSNADLCGADLRGANLSNTNFSNADLRYINFRYADFYNANLSNTKFNCANLSGAKNIIYADCSFAGHGECGRHLLAVQINGENMLYCGCFSGNEKSLREYIERNDERVRLSRLLALETVLKLIEVERYDQDINLEPDSLIELVSRKNKELNSCRKEVLNLKSKLCLQESKNHALRSKIG